MLLGIIGWIVVGIIAGFIASKNINLDPRLGIVAGIAGAVGGAAVFRICSGVAVSGFNVWSILFAALGAGGLLWVWHLISVRRSATGA